MPGTSLSRSMSMSQAPPPALPAKNIHMSQQSLQNVPKNPLLLPDRKLSSSSQPPLHLNYPPKPASLRSYPTQQQPQQPPVPPPPMAYRKPEPPPPVPPAQLQPPQMAPQMNRAQMNGGQMNGFPTRFQQPGSQFSRPFDQV